MEAIQTLGEDRNAFSISFAPGEADRAATWVELLAGGLTFDLKGLAPGAAGAAGPVLHRLDLGTEFIEAGLEAITLEPGPHLAAGTALPPVMRGLAGMAACLADLPDAVAVAWHPARCLSRAGPFSQAVGRWIGGGSFPGLGLVALAIEHDGALRSEGLAPFVGQDLRIEPELVDDHDSAAALALSLVHHLVAKGRLQGPERFAAPAGKAVRIEPSANKRFVRVWKAD